MQRETAQLTQDAKTTTAYEKKAVDDFLTHIPFFKQLPSDIVSALSVAASYVSAHPETTLVRQGAKGDSFYVIISGSVSVHKKEEEKNEDEEEEDFESDGEGGDKEQKCQGEQKLKKKKNKKKKKKKEEEEEEKIHEHLLDIDERYGPCVCVLTAGDSFGLLSLSKETERAASVITREETELIMIKKAVYDEYLKEHVNVIESELGGGQFGQALVSALTHRTPSTPDHMLCRRILGKPPSVRDSNDIAVLFRLFKTTQFFSQINQAALNAICKVACHVEVHAGDPVVEQGDAGDSFYVIISGYLEVRVLKEGRKSVIEAQQSTRKGRYTQIGGIRSRLLQRTQSMMMKKKMEVEVLGLDDDDDDNEGSGDENEDDEELEEFLKADANSEYGQLVGVISAGDSL